MELTSRQKEIIEIVKINGPVTGDSIGQKLLLTRSALRTDFRILVELGYIESKPKKGYIFKTDNIKSKMLINTDIEVKDIMSPSVSVEESISIHETIVMMFSKDVGSIFVTSGKFLKGIVSRKDLLKVVMGKIDTEKTPVSLVMTRVPNVIFTEKNDKIRDAVKKLIEHQIDSMPVIEKNGNNYEVIGRITKTNIAKLFLEIFQ
ncbi:helix-turn-helix transcriptional regulator [Cetobacterium sp.]|uniref:helix-turn-helix transcriptional regulator n=1 Tax=Cetobacterium sp. TaxID=2071632 RepID=UPI00163C04DE|nr:helix-turn-helix transcriptional regulator [Cetobacterium sp. 2A]MBC2855770.1 helix-turn-helix transcriptional regulator [Cetobacterium sp. 2A]